MPSPVIGHRLGPYEIVSLIGSGGMGEVYRARDTVLHREVAIKTLPEAFVADPERVARFEREARLLAALNHPHIAAIYGFEHREGIHALVLELVDGETLSARLRARALSVGEALIIARQLADALDAAHEKGIVHRDLKPANISMTRDDVVKVLDFGLAKTSAVASTGDMADAPTASVAATRDGAVLGTAPYMSPEQARGKSVDRRTDIWAFGCVLFEMLTGRAAFGGDTVSDVIVAILDRAPDWRLVPSDTPPTIARLLRRCLEKDPKRRLHDIADARIEIDDALSAPAADGREAAPRARRSVALWTLAGVVAGALVAAVGFRFATRPAPSAVTRFTIVLPPHLELRDPMALSPDGRTLVFAATDESGSRLYRRDLDSLQSVPIRGTEGGGAPFFSPDGATVGFSGVRSLMTVPLQGGAPTTLHQDQVTGATWLPDDTIVFGSSAGLMQIPATGGDVRAITTLRPGEIEHHSPVGLSNGRAVLFTVHTGRRDAQRIDAVSLPSRERTEITPGSGASVLTTGHIAFAFQQSGSLWVAPFDESRLRLTGSAAPALEGIMISDGWKPTIAAGANGSLAYAVGNAVYSYALRALYWVDKTGREQPIDAPTRAWWWPQVSPNGKQVGLHIMDPANMDAWIYELDHGPLVRVTFNPAQDGYPMWTRDGKRIVLWTNQPGGVRELRIRSATLTGSDEVLVTGADVAPFSWSGDGKLLVFQQAVPETKMDIGVVPIDGDHAVKMLINGPSDEELPAVSPDGKWIAYQSNQSGRMEVYVQPFPALGNRWQVSTQGGRSPLWDPDGHELYFRHGRSIVSVQVTAAGNAFSYGNPRPLFEGPYVTDEADPGGGPTYALSPDGKRFLMMKALEPDGGRSGQTQIVVVLNWLNELQRLLPAKR